MMSTAAYGASALLIFLAAAPLAQAQEPEPAPQIPLRVFVVTALESAPLGYSVVSIPAQSVERFTDATGRVVLPVAGTGRVLLRIKRLGFVPRDTTVMVTEPGQAVTVALSRVSFNLAAVRVVAWPPCRRPGIPRRGGDAQLRGIVEQLKQNAERYRLLVKSFPFSYQSERELSRKEPNGQPEIERTDTITVSGKPDWTYRPGRMLARDPSQGVNQWIMHIPVLSDLADESFIDNHCFHVAGLEQKEDQRLLRIDIVAAERLKSADVNVSVWLDPQGFQLRYASFTLTNFSRSFPTLLHVVSHVDYVEVAPSIPVMQQTVAENLVQELSRGRGATTMFAERQTILRLTFHGARP